MLQDGGLIELMGVDRHQRLLSGWPLLVMPAPGWSWLLGRGLTGVSRPFCSP